MKKYIVFYTKYDPYRHKQKVRNYYVKANNKMDAVRTFKENMVRSELYPCRTYFDNDLEGCVTLYEKPVFADRNEDYD